MRLAALTTLLVGTALASSLRYAEDQAPGIVNPLFSTTMSEARVNELLFDSLYTDDQDLAATPNLVAMSELSDDMMSMTLRLRDDVVWHDGQPLIADDVVFTIAAMRDDGTMSTEAGRVEWIDRAEATSAQTVILYFVDAEPRPEEKLFFKILPKHHFDGASVSRTHSFRTRPVGTGPFKLVRYNDDNSITFEANVDHRSSVDIPELVMREVTDKSYQAKLLIYESLEGLVRVLPRDLAVLQNNRKVELYPYQTNSWWYVGFNLENETFSDARVRQAMSYMVDVELLLAPIGTGELLTGPFVKSSPFYNHDVRGYMYDDMRAASLLNEAGYEQIDGAWVKDGEPLTITITAHQTLESAQEVVINLQSQLRGQGVEVDVEFLDEAAWKARIWREKDYQLVLSQWSFDRNEDVREQLHTDGARNFGGYSNPEVDALLDEARLARDPHVKKTALRKVHAIANQDAPMIYLWTLDSYSAVSTRVRNVVIHPFYFFTWISDWKMQ
ncbi:MAG: ABC transporter substrate-binding protein [Proteobacteria bacterium]|nr:ABC transporter substrate-binding protein [Pseudomonadota bacterium]MCP4921591.1 ABC transporter substrate-binding protein [Pseudomonadota bacterium]